MRVKETAKRRSLILLLITAILASVLSGCGKTNVSDIPGGGKWVDSDIVGTVKAEDNIRLQDDFAAAINKDYILSTEYDPDKGSVGPIYNTISFVTARYREALQDESITGVNADALRTYEELTLDWDNRNKLGVEPLRKYIDDILSISNIDEFTAYQGSCERNPFNLGLYMSNIVGGQIKDTDKSQLYLKPPAYSLGDKSYYKVFNYFALENKEKVHDTLYYFLSRLGFDEKEIKRIYKGNFRIETFLARHECMDKMNVRESLNEAQCDRETLRNYCKGYPLLEILDSRGFDKCNAFFVDYPYASSLEKIYDDDHLEDLKAFLIVQTIDTTKSLLDRESFEKVNEIKVSRTEADAHVIIPDDNDTFLYALQDGGMIPAMNDVYLKKYFPDESKIDMVSDFIDGLINSYRKMINEEDWMSDETKAKAIEKLDNMAIHVVRPDNNADYSKGYFKGYLDGGNLVDAAACGNNIINAHIAEKSANPLNDRFYWDIYDGETSTTDVNCFYMPSKNCFFILAGWVAVSDFIYGENASFEQFAGCVGAVAGHEISHGFDGSGSQYDLNGRQYNDDGDKVDWMLVEDRSRLDERATLLANYLSLIRPVPGKSRVLGGRVSNEAIADMGGIKAVLYMAKEIPDFNYDEFFRGYAALWAKLTTEKKELDITNIDIHPLAYIRINVTLQQFDEFIETYDIKPGDGMYLEPGKRVNVW